MVVRTENNGIAVRRVVGSSGRKRNRACVVVHSGKRTSFGEQRSPIFPLTTDAHRDSFNVFFELRRNEKRSWFTHQGKYPSSLSWTRHISTHSVSWCSDVGIDDRIYSGNLSRKKRTICISQASLISKKQASRSLEWSVTGNAG